MKSITQTGMIASLELLQKGMKVNIPADMPLMVRGVLYTPVTLGAVVQERLDALEAVIAARARLQAAIAHARATAAETAPFLSSLRTVLRAMFETDPEVLMQLGITPRKIPAKLTSAQLLQRTLNARATRAARHTMGPRQKAAIKGGGDIVAIAPREGVPVTASPAPAVTTSSAARPALAKTPPLAASLPAYDAGTSELRDGVRPSAFDRGRQSVVDDTATD